MKGCLNPKIGLVLKEGNDGLLYGRENGATRPIGIIVICGTCKENFQIKFIIVLVNFRI